MTQHRKRHTARQRTADLTVVALVAAAFGPYTPIPGVRTEQLAVIAVCGVGLLLAGQTMWWVPAAAAVVGGLLLSQAAIAVAASIGSAAPAIGYAPIGFTAGLDNLLLPLAVLITGHVLTVGDVDRARLVRVAGTVLVAALCVNAGLAYLTLTQAVDLTPALSRFWSSANPGAVTTASRAAEMGRYSGIFNQPAEAGVMYSIGLIMAAILLRRRPVLLAVTGVALTIGGLLTASKIFLLVGLPVALWQGLRAATWPGRAGIVAAVFAVFAVFDYQASQPDSPIGGVLLDDWLNPGDRGGSLVSLYSANRFGEQSTLADAAGLVLDHAPWFGFGVSGIAVAYDSSWVEALVMVGMFGVAVQALIMIVFVGCWLHARRIADPMTVRLGGGLLLVVLIGSLGLPTLTANRVTTVVWLLVWLLLIHPATRCDAATPMRDVPADLPLPGAVSVAGPGGRRTAATPVLAAANARPGPAPVGSGRPRPAVAVPSLPWPRRAQRAASPTPVERQPGPGGPGWVWRSTVDCRPYDRTTRSA